MDPVQESELIRSVLVENFPEECQRVGRTNLNDIVRRRGQVRIIPMAGASRLDWSVTLSLLASAATLLSHCLTISKNNLDSSNNGNAGWIIHFHQTNHVSHVAQAGQDGEPSRISLVNQIKLTLPPEIVHQLEPAVVDRLVSSFVSHLDAQEDGESDGPA